MSIRKNIKYYLQRPEKKSMGQRTATLQITDKFMNTTPVDISLTPITYTLC